MLNKQIAKAKINLCLHVTGQDKNGYHLLDSIVTFANYGDELIFRKNETFEIVSDGQFSEDLNNIPITDNIIYKAAKELRLSDGFKIDLKKKLPLSAGIGGGSADAAATFRGLIEYCNTSLPIDNGLTLGADVPVCLKSTNQRMQGIGEILSDIEFLPKLSAVLVNSGDKVSTSTIFKILKSKANKNISSLPNKKLTFFETIHFFQKVSLSEFLFGTKWSPQTALRSDQVAADGSFGAIPLITGTLLISTIAMCIATPLGLFSAIYLSEYASKKTRNIIKPLLEILAGIPTVVYGFFAALTVAPIIRSTGETVGLNVSSESALAAGLIMGIMIIPLISSLSDDVINAVPQSLRDASLGLGSTNSETIRKVILPAAIPGISGSLLLAASRAIGETMIVVMAAGLAANLTANPLEAVTTITAQIVALLTGDQEFDSAKTLSAFALGLLLFIVTLILNMISLKIVNKYREQYD